jgi:demethylmenaquinone methyltransferase/2-methoxy-6-polyprenyl-1,4-benzoquinol methylase
LANTLISFGIHHFWRKTAIKMIAVPSGGKIIDVCCGTGMITMDLARKAGTGSIVVGLDFSAKMLEVARARLEHTRCNALVQFIEADANIIPFPDNSFDCATIGYGLRNISDPKRLLLEVQRVVKPGGRVLSLEMTKPYLPIFKDVYECYLNHWVPLLGRLLTHNQAAYRYLHDSIASFIHKDQVSKIYQELNFKDIQCHDLTWGIAVIHLGRKP